MKKLSAILLLLASLRDGARALARFNVQLAAAREISRRFQIRTLKRPAGLVITHISGTTSAGESQRDSGAKPKVARHELPWVNGVWSPANPNGVAASARPAQTQPRWGWRDFLRLTQGSSCLATLGWWTQSLWDCPQFLAEIWARTKLEARFNLRMTAAREISRRLQICTLKRPEGRAPFFFSSHFFWLPVSVLLVAAGVSLHAQDSVTTLAGKALVSGAANGTGTNAAFSDPAAIVADVNGNFFVADSRNHAIRKITAGGAVTTFAGQLGVAGTANGTGAAAQFNSPCGLAFDTGGNLFVSDTGNSTIRKITSAGAVTTLAGVAGSSAFLNGTAGGALFNSPLGLAVWTNGNVFVADSGNHCIRKISGGVVSTFAGKPQIWGSANSTGTNAQFNSPCGLAFDKTGNLFVCDANNNTIRKITTGGVVTTFAGAAGLDGSTDGALTSARFRSPAELAFDQRGNLFVADSFNQTIRKIATNGIVSTVSGTAGISGTNSGTNGRFFNPYGIVVAADGSLVVADTYNELVRVVLVPFKLALNISGAAHTATISWDTVIGKKYQVQFKTDLAAAWTNLGAPQTATDFSLSATDTSAMGMKAYRVLLLP